MPREPKIESAPITVAIVEDNKDLRAGIATVVKNAASCLCVGEFSRGEDLIHNLARIAPKVILMDIGLPGISGIEATTRIKDARPETEIVILTVFEDDDNVFKAICAGASGYVTKPVLPRRLLEAIEEAYRGGTPMSPHIARKVINLFKQHVPPPKADYNLSPREIEVLEALVQGCDFKEIADTLVISVFTVRAHIRNIYEKLHVHSKSQAVAKALRENLI